MQRAMAEQRQDALARQYLRVRQLSEHLCEPLEVDDYQIQSITETSPPKWHLAHVSWFFEAFVLEPYLADYQPFDQRFAFLFNSYYQTVGRMQPRPSRGLLSRPTVAEVYRYRAHVDEAMQRLFARTLPAAARQRVVLGLHHEQQHQELLLMDVKHNHFVNPLKPAYREALPAGARQAPAQGWLERAGGIREIGAAGDGFAFDNETPRHRELLHPHRLADRLVTNGEYLAFVEDGGYRRPDLWLADGWALLQEAGWQHPLYWQPDGDGRWQEFTLAGPGSLDPAAPVVHVSFFEADAYARWAGRRLPSEAELEDALAGLPVAGNLLETGRLHPAAGTGQWYGDVWEWTGTAYHAYPGFRPLAGSLGEYNGKFMCNQFVLRGGCCVTSRDHVRATYRNFFYPHDRWAFTGIRLADDAD